MRTDPGIQALDQIDGIEIEDVLVNAKSIAIGQPFPADDEWLKDIVFRVRNVSNQKLTAIQLDMVFPDMKRLPDVVLCYGCAPNAKENGVKPGEEVELRMLGGNYYGWLKDRISENGSISRITRAEIREMLVTLPGATKWLSGCIKTASPKNSCPHPTQ